MASPGGKVEVDIPAFPIHTVVVYPDRAEVTRCVEVRLEAGEGEVVLKSLSRSLDKDSVRVDGIGPGSITEVSFQELAVSEEEAAQASSAASEELAQIEARIKELGKTISASKAKATRLKNQEDMLDEYAGGLVEVGKDANSADLISAHTTEGMFTFLETYEEKLLELKRTTLDLDKDAKTQTAELQKLQQQQSNLKPRADKTDAPEKQQVIGILLTMKETGKIQLLVSYIVLDASWSPKYDLRVSSADRSMQVNYFGMVKQNSGEDWTNAKLLLSTAAPSIGGSAPELETAKISLTHYEPTTTTYSFGELGGGGGGGGAGAMVTEGLSSCVFPITALANIPADSSGHKVCIGAVSLIPIFEYDTVPKLAQHAFLRATARNESHYPFLAGPANVFLDQSYVTHTSLKAVSPNEEFSCSLGADSSVKVVYKPVKRYREEGGILAKNVTVTYTQITEITNTRNETTVVTFTDQVPKSQDEKLKVTLLEPVIPKQRTGGPPTNPKMNAQHNVEWKLELKEGETRSITIQYRVEYPAKKKVEGLD